MDKEQWWTSRLVKIEMVTAAYRGPKYLSAVVLCLTRVLEVQFAMVTERLPGLPQRGRAVAFADAQNTRQPFVYDTASYPCHTVLAGEAVSVPCNAAELYPGVSRVDAYVGHPLRNAEGEVIGLLAIEHTDKLEQAPQIAQLLMLLSGRVAAELECVLLTPGLSGAGLAKS